MSKPRKNEFSKVIATRRLIAQNIRGRKSEIMVRISKPVSEKHYYRCCYTLEGLSKEIESACGEDAVQALELGLKKIGRDLDHLQKAKKLKITWLGMHHSFPEVKISTIFPSKKLNQYLKKVDHLTKLIKANRSIPKI